MLDRLLTTRRVFRKGSAHSPIAATSIAASAAAMATATTVNAAAGEAAVHSSPARADAAKLPTLCTAASSPNAEPRISAGAKAATAACSAVSTQPMPTPARTKATRGAAIAGPGEREQGVGDAERGDADGQWPRGRVPSRSASARPGSDHGGGDVVADVEPEGDLRGGLDPRPGVEEFGGAQDQQRRGDVADLERGMPAISRPSSPVQHRADLEPDRSAPGARAAWSGGWRRRSPRRPAARG